MKKIFAIVAVLVAAMSLSSCEFDTQIYTRDYLVHPADWKLVEGPALNTYLYATFPCDAITRGVVDNGTVSADFFISSENTWTALPYIIPFEYDIVDERTGIPTGLKRSVTEVIRFEWAEEEITFIIQDMDGAIPAPVEGDFAFRVSIMR